MTRFEIAIVILSIALLAGAVTRHFKHAHDAAKRIVPNAAQKQWILDQEAQWGVKQPAPGAAGRGNIAIGLPDTIDIPFGYDATKHVPPTTSLGTNALYENETCPGDTNLSYGAGAGRSTMSTTGDSNTPYSYDATSDSTTAVGFQSMQNAARGTNTVVGYGRNKANKKKPKEEKK